VFRSKALAQYSVDVILCNAVLFDTTWSFYSHTARASASDLSHYLGTNGRNPAPGPSSGPYFPQQPYNNYNQVDNAAVHLIFCPWGQRNAKILLCFRNRVLNFCTA
jgi:hypothetical protein